MLYILKFALMIRCLQKLISPKISSNLGSRCPPLANGLTASPPHLLGKFII